MTLEMLIEEQKSIKSIIDEKIDSMKEWFKDKISNTKDIFGQLKDKVMSIFSKNIEKEKLSKKIAKDIELEKNGKKVKIVSKGESVGSAITKIKSLAKSQLNEVKKLGDKAIGNCQKGIRLLMGIKDEDLEKDVIVREVHENKVNVMGIVKTIASVATAINATCGAYRSIAIVGGALLI